MSFIPHQQEQGQTSFQVPRGRTVGSNNSYVLDALYLFCLAKQTCLNLSGCLCTHWSCKQINPPQAVPGQYNCQGYHFKHGKYIECPGTYVILPSKTITATAYPYPDSPSRHGRHRAISQFFGQQRREQRRRREQERAEEAMYNARSKPLPSIPGLESRRRRDRDGAELGFGARAVVTGTVHPPAENAYYPQLRAKHSLAARNLRQGQPLYPVNNSQIALSTQIARPGVSRTQGHSRGYPIPCSHASNFNQESTSSYSEVYLYNGRSYL